VLAGAVSSLAGVPQGEQGRQGGGSQDQSRDHVIMKASGSEAAHTKELCPGKGRDQTRTVRHRHGCAIAQERNQCLNLNTAPHDNGSIPTSHTSSSQASHGPSRQTQGFTSAQCPSWPRAVAAPGEGCAEGPRLS